MTRFQGLLTAGVTAVAIAGSAGAASAATPTGTIMEANQATAIAGSYIVTLQPGEAVSTEAQRLVRRHGGSVRENFTAAVRGFHATMTRTQARRLAADPAVKSVEQDAKITADAVQTNPTWGLDRIDQAALPLSKSYTHRSAAGVTAYVLDTGIRVTSQEFGGRARDGYDAVDKDTVAQDCNGHGTHVAGTIGGAKYGVAKDVKLVGVRVLDCTGSGSYSAIIAGVDWVTKNAVKPAVANMSLGGSTSKTLDDAVRKSIASGVTYALAAGNENKDACQQSPARQPDAITVAATDSTDTRAAFSNFGTCVDIFAPGVKITSASNKSDNGIATMSGTSMASPHVAGAAALMLGANPKLTPQQVRDALVADASTKIQDRAGSPAKLLNTSRLNA